VFDNEISPEEYALAEAAGLELFTFEQLLMKGRELANS